MEFLHIPLEPQKVWFFRVTFLSGFDLLKSHESAKKFLLLSKVKLHEDENELMISRGQTQQIALLNTYYCNCLKITSRQRLIFPQRMLKWDCLSYLLFKQMKPEPFFSKFVSQHS